MIFGAPAQKILIFGAPGIENIDFGAPEAATKGGDPSTCQNPPESIEKTMVLGGGLRTRHSHARNPGPPKALKSKTITKSLKLKLRVNSRKHD